MSPCLTRKAYVWLILFDDEADIEKIVIPSYHTHYFFNSANTARGKVINDLWILAGALGELLNVNVTYFEYKCRRNVDKLWWARTNTVLDIVSGMLIQEKATGQ